jgi:Fe-S cluster assembly protein SufD
LPEGVVVESLAAALAGNSELVERYLHRAEALEDGPFAALNTALFADGLFVYVPKGVTLERPLHVLVLASGNTVDGAPPVSFPRLLLVVEENAEAKIIETYAPWRLGISRYRNMLVAPQIVGYKKHPILHAEWQFVDVSTGQ